MPIRPGYGEVAFFPDGKYQVVWVESRQGWIVYADVDGSFT